MGDDLDPKGTLSESRRRRRLPFETLLLLDLLREKRTRRVFAYVFANVVFGALIYHWLEGWDILDSFYFVIITLTTIGYGDFSPTMPITKLITIFYALNGVAILLILLDEIRRLRGMRFGETHAQE
jgi:hypothetical protein